MFPVQNSISEFIHCNGKDVVIYGSDQFFINGLRRLLMDEFNLEFCDRFRLLVIKIWTDVSLTDSVYMSSQPADSVFVVICPLHTMNIVRGVPGYDKAIFLDSRCSFYEFTSQLKTWLDKNLYYSAGVISVTKAKPIYVLNSKETSLIAAILTCGKVRTIAREQHVSTKTVYSRLYKLYKKFEVNSIQELVKKIHILFKYEFWNKNDFNIIE